MPMNVKARETCRICGSNKLVPVLSLGNQLLASVTVTKENEDRIPQNLVPLEVVRCLGECKLVQLKHTYPSDLIYREYWYRSGVNQSMKDALMNIVDSAKRYVQLKRGDIVVDIGCNDGTLLDNYNKKLFRVGFDPVENIKGEKEGFKRIIDYFNVKSFIEACGNKKAKVITSIAMFYDLEDPNTFVSDISNCLDDNGIWIVQMADLPEMLKNNMFDQIVHEHLEYYHITPFKYLIEKHGMTILDMEKNEVNGSSYRFYVRKKGYAPIDKIAEKEISIFMQEEERMELGNESVYNEFCKRSEKIKNDLITFIKDANLKGKKVFAYGASTKGNVLLQYCGFTSKDILYCADRNPLKWGGRMIGSNIPIISEDDARMMKPDYFLILPYHFMDEILNRESKFLNEGGQFLVPIPEVHCISSSEVR